MSTEHQKYSTENQGDAIRQYAAQRGFEIVRTYADEGRSGLSLDGRDAFKRLIDDVKGGQADFQAILVYDVSRWGRFQDADEGGYYEYVCKRAGISVHFCAEQFENDGSSLAGIVKAVKRSMAGEYSRELSVKVFAGQCRLIELGFRQGGPAGYGLRRQLIDQNKAPKGQLGRGEKKSLQTDRVVLIPGPDTEVSVVRRMYRMFVKDGRSEREIADTLNAEGLQTDAGRPWSRASVHQVLTNEKYIGNNVFNRVSFKLKRKRVRNTPDMWIRAEGAFKPIVQLDLFTAARTIINDRNRRYGDEQMLDLLKGLLEKHGALTGIIIDETEGLPSSGAYAHRFGSLLRAYRLIGYDPGRDYRYIEVNRTLRSLHPDVVSTVVAGIENVGGRVAQDPATDLMRVNDEFTMSVVIARCRRTNAGAHRWKLRFDAGLMPDITVAVRMDAANVKPVDYYLLPALDLPKLRVALGEENEARIDAYRFETLDYLFHLASRTPVDEAA